MRNMKQALPKLITFDCAFTLLDVLHTPYSLLQVAAAEYGLLLSDEQIVRYAALHASEIDLYWEINRTKDELACDSYWIDLIGRFLASEGLDERCAEPLARSVGRMAFEEPSYMFQLYEDVLPCFNRLQSIGIRIAVISNWDFTLDRALRLFGLDRLIDFSIASRLFGFEKPDPEIFHYALELSGCSPGEVVHVGDDPVDDIQGASGVGIRAIHIDRKSLFGGGDISTLNQLVEVL